MYKGFKGQFIINTHYMYFDSKGKIIWKNIRFKTFHFDFRFQVLNGLVTFKPLFVRNKQGLSIMYSEKKVYYPEFSLLSFVSKDLLDKNVVFLIQTENHPIEFLYFDDVYITAGKDNKPFGIIETIDKNFYEVLEARKDFILIKIYGKFEGVYKLSKLKDRFFFIEKSKL